MKKTKLVVLLFCVFTGCLANWPHRYGTIKPEINVNGPGNVFVLSKDERPGVISGKEKPETVGKVKALLDGPWKMVTKGGKPFGEVLSSAVCNAFTARDFQCTPLEAKGGDFEAEIDSIIRKYPATHILFLTVKEWQVESFARATVRYDISLNIFDGQGISRGLAAMTGEDQLSVDDFLNPAKNASLKAPIALKEIIELMLNDPKIIKVLNY